MKTCEKCNKEFDGKGKLCGECAAEPVKLEDKKLSPKRFILIAADFALIIIGLLVFLIPTFFDSSRNLSGSYNLTCYIDGTTLYCRNIADLNADVVTLAELDEAAVELVDCKVTYSDDSTVVFFPGEINADGSFKLCYYDFKTNGPVTEVAQNVEAFCISADGTKVHYINSGSELYASDLSAATKIAENIMFVEASDDGSRIVYTTDSGETYLKSALGEPFAASGKNGYYKTVNDFGAVIVFENDGRIKRVDFDGNVTDIAQSNDNAYVYESGELYYVDNEIGDQTDSAYGADAAVVSIYYYNGSQSVLVTDRAYASVKYSVGAGDYTFAEGSAAIVYKVIDESFEITAQTTAEELIANAAVYHSTGASETIRICEADKYTEFYLSPKGTHIFCNEEIEAEDGSVTYNLYEINLANGDQAQLLEENYDGVISLISTDDTAAYTKTVDGSTNLYYSGTLMVENLVYDNITKNFGNACYGVSTETGIDLYGYLYYEVRPVAQNVDFYTSYTDDVFEIFYTLSLEDGTVELYRFDAWGSNVLVASGDVRHVVPMYED